MNNLDFAQFPSSFIAQYPSKLKESSNSSIIASALNPIYQFIHKKIGLFVLIAQRNPNHFSQAEGEVGHKKLEALGGKRISFQTADGEEIKGMHFIGKECAENSPTLILFNGNGLRYEEYGSQTIKSIRLFNIKNWLKLGVNVLIFNYRGINQSPGSATRNGLILDGDAAVQYVRDVLKVPEQHIILHGHSLGGAIASEVGALHPQMNYCNDRSFSSLSQHVKIIFGGRLIGKIAAKLLVAYGWEFDTVSNWDKIKGHRWVIYHPNDRIIPFGARLIDKINKQASMIQMQAQWIQTKNGNRPEDPALLEKPTQNDFSFSQASAHMRQMRGPYEKELYSKQIQTALSE